MERLGNSNSFSLRTKSRARPIKMVYLWLCLRSKRIQSSYCAKVGANKRLNEESRPNFLDELARKRMLCKLSVNAMVTYFFFHYCKNKILGLMTL